MPTVLTIIFLILVCVDERLSDHSIDDQDSKHVRVLSRKRRYLTFPVGSSAQLVYCFTIPVYANAVFATTAALAWMLPTDPDDILPQRILKNKQNQNSNEKVDRNKVTYIKKGSKNSHIYTMNSATYNKPINYRVHYMEYPQPVRYKTISLSPSYKKSNTRTSYKKSNTRTRYYPKTTKNTYYAPDQNRVTSYMDPVHHEWHRRSRRELFGKIEKFFKAQRKDGRACLLKAVCEVSQARDGELGTFIQEIIKAIFRSYRSHTGQEDIYDAASKIQHNCSEIYPTCDFTLWEVF
ncbi:DM4/DM12 family [Popillia japonica]|uniref:DM4/DM12 family n=1 Tax=Popillia japonica TaxID=7064 RepID=A0AAW1N7P7_POPJA